MGNIIWQFQKPCTLTQRNNLKLFIQDIFKQEKKCLLELAFVFCDDEYLLGINRSFLNHDYFTDIITFDLTEPGAKLITGEIYISIDTVRDNAKQYKRPFSEELHRVIFHGCLHLCGFKDKAKPDQLQMRRKEDHYLERYGFKLNRQS